MTTTKVICCVNTRVGPVTKAQGRNAMMVVRTPKMTGFITSWVPRTAASMPSRRPLSTSLWMFSPTTMASSTITPITSSTAKVDRMFQDTPMTGKNMMLPANAVKMPAVTQMATTGRRNSSSTIITRMAPDSADALIRSIRSWKVLESSHRTSIFTPSGRIPLAGSLARLI